MSPSSLELTGENNIKKNIIGLTGFYASGKTEAQKILKSKFKYFIIDVDKTGHWALEKKKNELIKIFGKAILTGKIIDRKKLGQIVFNNEIKLKKLNSIVHPVMTEKIKKEIKKSGNKNICIDAALLFDMGLDKLCDKIIIVKASIFNIIRRAKKRDGSSAFRTLKILSYQKKLKNIKNKKVIYLKNDSSLEKLFLKIKEII